MIEKTQKDNLEEIICVILKQLTQQNTLYGTEQRKTSAIYISISFQCILKIPTNQQSMADNLLEILEKFLPKKLSKWSPHNTKS